MTKFSDNDSPSLLFTEQGSTPTTPAASHQRLFIRTSDHTLCYVNSSGTVTQVKGSAGGVATDAIWTTSGKVAVATGSATATEQWPPAHEFDYAQFTADVTISATSEGAANTVIAGNSVTYDGSPVLVQFFSPRVDLGVAATLVLDLYMDSTIQGRMNVLTAPTALSLIVVANGFMRVTPSNAAHTFTVKGWRATANCTVGGAAGGTGAHIPGFVRVTKA
jgi:hypothetical protein